MTTIVLYPDSTPSVSCVVSSLRNSEIIERDDVSKHPIKKRNCTKLVCMADISRRLARRKVLYNRLCSITHTMCFLALSGLILMIFENELIFRTIDHRQTWLSSLIKTTISITTVILVMLVTSYNRLDLEMYAVNNSLGHWRVGLTGKKIVMIVLEIFICSIHPFPSYRTSYHSTLMHPIPLSHIERDVALGLPMFARIYLLCRFLMFHSHLVRSISSQSLGSLNQVSINFLFLLKTYLEKWPISSLVVFSTSLFLIGSWSFRACNYNSNLEHLSITNSFWLLIVTFTTVGYGDLTPSTYCGRSIAAIIALIGIFSTALLISVLAQKLQFTRAEKYVYNFILKRQLAEQHRAQAANIIKYAWIVWYLQRKYTARSTIYIEIQRKLVRSIHFKQRLKLEQSKLSDHCIGFPEIITTQREMNEQIQKMLQRSIQMEQTIVQINQRLINS